jgi:hypothetical protein
MRQVIHASTVISGILALLTLDSRSSTGVVHPSQLFQTPETSLHVIWPKSPLQNSAISFLLTSPARQCRRPPPPAVQQSP